MRPFLNLMLIVVVALCSVGQSFGQTPGEARARAALILAQAERERDNATVKAALMLAKCQRDRCGTNDAGCLQDLGQALTAAKAAQQPLFIWVGMSCETSIRDRFPTSVHCHLRTMNGDATPRVIVGRPGTTYYRFERKDFYPDTPTDIRRVLQQSQVAAPVRAANC